LDTSKLTINGRINYLRKNLLHLNQTDFAKTIGMKQTGVSYMEQEGATVTEQAIKSICAIHSISEQWLRYGSEPIKIEPELFSLDNFIEERGGTNLEKEIIKTYFELDPEVRKAIFDHFKNKFFTPPKPKSGFEGIPSSDELLEMYPDLLKEDEKGIS
jgi:DNA-binding XRE family transcriptional regulator